MSPHDILALDRLAFLALALSRMGLPEAAVADLTKTHSDSTRRLCGSGWKMFQSFVRQIRVTCLAPVTLASFTTSIFHSSPTVSPATVTSAMVAIRDPVTCGFGVGINRRTWDLLRSSSFIQ